MPAMSRAAASLVAVLFAALVVAAQEPAPAPGSDTTPSTAAEDASEPTTQTSEVIGTVPDLTGRWFLLADLSFPNNPAHVLVPSFWVVSNVDGKPDVQMRFVKLPPSVAGAFEAANKERKSWTPTAQDLETIAEQWDSLPPEDRGFADVAIKLVGKDGFDDTINGEDRLKDSTWVAQVSGNFRPGGGRPVREVTILGANQQTEDGWSGNYMSVAVANAPFPVPIQLNGTFRMWKVDARPARGILSRIADWFAGCGRKP
jgi:hypothetical protein